MNNQPKTTDQRLDDIMAVLVGGHDSNGVYFPGLSPRMQSLEKRVEHIERETEKASEDRLTFGRGAGLLVFGGAITQAFSWVKEHLAK